MLRTLRTRRRPRYGAQVCAIMAAILLLLSVSVLHSRLSGSSNPRFQQQQQNVEFTHDSIDDLDALVANPLLEDVENDGNLITNSNKNNINNNEDDLIDELDAVDEEQSRVSDEEEILRGLEDDSEFDGLGLGFKSSSNWYRRSGFYWDHASGVRRRAFDKQLGDPWEDDDGGIGGSEDKSKVVFASDDQPINEDVRVKFDGIKGIEDALLLKTGKRNSPLREGWATWFEKKGDFLRRDKMFRSNLELLNPVNNPLLQDPDGIGLTFMTKGDKIMQKALLDEVQKLHSGGKKPFGVVDIRASVEKKGVNAENIGFKKVNIVGRNEVKGVERRTLDVNGSGTIDGKKVFRSSEASKLTKTVDIHDGSYHNDVLKEQIMSYDKSSDKKAMELNNGADKVVDSSIIEFDQQSRAKKKDAETQVKAELSGEKYADGKRWGYFPGFYPHLSFSEFMEEFFKQGKCSMRVFMVWNSSPWMYTVRHQRGLESLLYHHPDACVVVFSETIDLDFFKDFVKDGYKVAVAMPNLDELLNDTPTHIFASMWFEWRKTKFYEVHYSELVRLAALYKYGGIYLDSDVIVLKPLSSLNNTLGTEDESEKRSFNGAVMIFSKNSHFIMECLREFYSTYDDTLLRWNGAELLTRTVKRLTEENNSDKLLEVKIQPSSVFFPITSQDITRYFSTPADETERTKQYVLLLKILDGSYTFHFWNGLTSALIPEPESLVAKLLNHHCIHCHDVL
ncbi:Lactosylceramide 4-alpha-galactosyltransferase [Thalictrum thalictroides]|uniref:Lactosylceramide 4-alpha-galactosyltransferase n=1 Tax=Thalictrum thalictroides TaxID=46969 RepID=A0A7J6W1L8_THATH|nr:Lactosylceramide 4-alpha-galactosyltransferase [Thalictrum thalictroides]